MTRAVVVHVGDVNARAHGRSDEARLEEIINLAGAINLDIVEGLSLNLRQKKPGTLLTKGHIENLQSLCEDQEVEILVINHALSPVQQRNLERAINVKVIDRTGLILEIFGDRAQTKEGRIQVDLAMLDYQRSRLVRSWTHLERQRGGAGFMGGPGETQLEIDRRIIGDKISKLKKDLEKVRQTRHIQSQARAKIPYPVVALVGYTNAGKSSLFNILTDADVMAEDMVFATLDPTMRKLELPQGSTVVLSDTVGFISDLPTHLIEAFKATLEQVTQADIICHVRDIANEDSLAQRVDVISVLSDLGIDYAHDPRIIEVANKIDLWNTDAHDPITAAAIPVSAVSGEGLNNLLIAIEEKLHALDARVSYILEATQGKALAWLFEHGYDIERHDNENGDIHISLSLPNADQQRFESMFGA